MISEFCFDSEGINARVLKTSRKTPDICGHLLFFPTGRSPGIPKIEAFEPWARLKINNPNSVLRLRVLSHYKNRRIQRYG